MREKPPTELWGIDGVFTSKHPHETVLGDHSFWLVGGTNAHMCGYHTMFTSKHYHISPHNLFISVFTYTRTIRGVDCDLSLREQQLFSHHYPQSLPYHMATIVSHYPHKQWSIDSIALSMYSHLIVYTNDT